MPAGLNRKINSHRKNTMTEFYTIAPRGNGYDGYSMSNNARAAYDDGAVPLSGITAEWVKCHNIGCTVTELKALIGNYQVTSSEYHHTGKHFNRTDFYRPEDVREQVAQLSREDIDVAKAAVKAQTTKDSEVTVHKNCHVEWLEWFGTRAHPKAERETAEGATVSVKGQTATITFADGKSMTKRLSTNGFSFETAKARKERQVLERQREREEKARWNDLNKRFKAAAQGAKFESTPYFAWRDDANRDSTAVAWAPITHDRILAELKSSGAFYAERAVARLEEGEREVIRLGLHIGIRKRGNTADTDGGL